MPAQVTAIKRGSTEEGAPYLTAHVTIRGTRYDFRELTVEENDECADASREENGLINGRTMMRFVLMKAAQEPKITPEILSRMPQAVYLALCDTVNELLAPAEPDAEPGKD